MIYWRHFKRQLEQFKKIFTSIQNISFSYFSFKVFLSFEGRELDISFATHWPVLYLSREITQTFNLPKKIISIIFLVTFIEMATWCKGQGEKEKEKQKLFFSFCVLNSLNRGNPNYNCSIQVLVKREATGCRKPLLKIAAQMIYILYECNNFLSIWIISNAPL